MSVATGRALTGEYVHFRGCVLYVTLEDSLDELRRRVRAARIYHRIAAEELSGWMYLWAPPRGTKIAIKNSDGTINAGLLETQLRTIIADKHIALIIIDPFIKSYGGDIAENSNNEIDAVCEIIAHLAIELNLAPDLLHHDAKTAREPGDSNRGRGASSFRNAIRLGNTLTTMSPDEAKNFEISQAERRFYVRLDPAKVNLAPANETRWFKLVGVRLGNKNPHYPNGDTVQTVEFWQPPETWAYLSHDTLNAALTAIENGMPNGQRYSAANAARGRAAWQIVKKHCPQKTEAQCREIIRTWLVNGVLFDEDYPDPVFRETAKGLRINQAKRPS
jgi:hypothetical protein